VEDGPPAQGFIPGFGECQEEKKEEKRNTKAPRHKGKKGKKRREEKAVVVLLLLTTDSGSARCRFIEDLLTRPSRVLTPARPVYQLVMRHRR
jgi:hypothetical protein